MLQAYSCKCLQWFLIHCFFFHSNKNSRFYSTLSHFHGSTRVKQYPGLYLSLCLRFLSKHQILCTVLSSVVNHLTTNLQRWNCVFWAVHQCILLGLKLLMFPGLISNRQTSHKWLHATQKNNLSGYRNTSLSKIQVKIRFLLALILR